MDKSNARRHASAEKARASVRDRRRHYVSPVPTGETRHLASEDAARTKFLNTVKQPDPEGGVLMSGINSVKLGGDVLVGAQYGTQIMSLTLEERATCPRSCPHWVSCYGNNMSKSIRWAQGDDLLKAIEADVVRELQKRPLLVRLHVLGDFYSMDYLEHWVRLIDDHENLSVFGFTAWPTNTPIGAGIARVREALPERFCIRTSGTTGKWGSFSIDMPTTKRTLGDAVVCPEQVDAMNGGAKRKHCGNCAVCWQTDRPIVFVEH